jgi:N-acetylglutamate synthase-like GNAT family acetyltransferase
MSLPPLRAARPADRSAIRTLLEASALPTADLETSAARFVVACEGPDLVATGALEVFGTTGLLRSLAVDAAHRGTGIGRAIVGRLEQEAGALALGEIVLLTLTARGFFERQGYRVIAREAAPAAVRASEEFRRLCPQSASCLSKELAPSAAAR